MKKIVILLMINIGLIAAMNIAAQNVYYVDAIYGSDNNTGLLPDNAFKTLVKVKEEVRAINSNMDQNIIINLREGVYILDTTFTLTAEDCGTNGYHIIYQAYNCEKPMISGGRNITAWELHDSENDIYKAYVESSVNARQLYVNNERGIRARSIDAQGWAENGDGYECPSEIASWENIHHVEVVSYKHWKCHRGPIAFVSGTHAVMAQPYWNNVHNQYDAPPVWIENAYELLDSEGEWYLDFSTDTIYYKPKAGENIYQSEIIYPKVEVLLDCDQLNNVQFNGITFAYSAWNSPNSSNGFACLQAEAWFVDMTLEQITGNIKLSHCSNIQFNSCTFEHIGTTALQLFDGCKDFIIYNNTFTDISGSAISVGNIFNPYSSEEDLLQNNLIENNLISDVANEYKGCVGIFVAYAENAKIKHNEIRNLPYSGISVGWGWSNTATVAQNNEISYNLLDSVVTTLEDGGAIYTLSAQAGTEIHDNYIKDQINYYGALYPDEGSSYMHWHHNVVRDAPLWLHMWTESIQFDTIDYNYYNSDQSTQNGVNCVIENNIFVINDNWPQEALSIMDNAGRIETQDCVPVYTSIKRAVLHEQSILMNPNPVDNVLHISLNNNYDSECKAYVYDLFGKLMDESTSNSHQQFDINFNGFPVGMYLVHIKTLHNTYCQKVIKN